MEHCQPYIVSYGDVLKLYYWGSFLQYSPIILSNTSRICLLGIHFFVLRNIFLLIECIQGYFYMLFTNHSHFRVYWKRKSRSSRFVQWPSSPVDWLLQLFNFHGTTHALSSVFPAWIPWPIVTSPLCYIHVANSYLCKSYGLPWWLSW